VTHLVFMWCACERANVTTVPAQSNVFCSNFEASSAGVCGSMMPHVCQQHVCWNAVSSRQQSLVLSAQIGRVLSVISMPWLGNIWWFLFGCKHGQCNMVSLNLCMGEAKVPKAHVYSCKHRAVLKRAPCHLQCPRIQAVQSALARHFELAANAPRAAVNTMLCTSRQAQPAIIPVGYCIPTPGKTKRERLSSITAASRVFLSLT
jgi:hypothetical protein